MSIQNKTQLRNTQTKLQELEQAFSVTRDRPSDSEHVRELTLRSLKKRINQFKEEIARFEAHSGGATPNGTNGEPERIGEGPCYE